MHAEASDHNAKRFLLIDITELFGLCSTKEVGPSLLFIMCSLLLFAVITMLLFEANAGNYQSKRGVVDIDDCREEPCPRRFMFSPTRTSCIELFGAICRVVYTANDNIRRMFAISSCAKRIETVCSISRRDDQHNWKFNRNVLIKTALIPIRRKRTINIDDNIKEYLIIEFCVSNS